MSSRPVNAGLAIALSLLPVPVLYLLDRANSGCGDGLCSLFSGLMLLGALAALVIVFIRRSARRDETPAALRLVPLALWALALFPLVF